MEEKTAETLEAVSCSKGVRGIAERLGTDLEKGLPDPVADWKDRVKAFGENKFAEKKLTPYWWFLWQAVQDKIMLLLLFMATLELIVKSIFAHGDERTSAIAESCVLYLTVFIIINIQSMLDWQRERMYERLSKRLASSNLRYVIRGGRQMQLTDEKICVGDLVSFNSHLAATISCDGLLVSGQGVKCDESALTGEPKPISKSQDVPFMISGTTVTSGQGTMLIVAVGEFCIAGKIKKQVYADEDAEPSPLFFKAGLHGVVDRKDRHADGLRVPDRHDRQVLWH